MTFEHGKPDDAIPKLLQAHADHIYGLGLRMCGSPEAAEELVQETFLQAFRKWDQFEGRSKASTWLYTIAARLCHRKRRRRAGEPARLDSLEELLDKYRDIPGTQDDPLQSLLRKEWQQTAGEAIAALPEAFRLPLLLKELADLSVVEIARALRLKQSTVKTRIHRARLFLATEIARLAKGEARPPEPHHSRNACIELLNAKQDAMDQGVTLHVSDRELCERCRLLFQSLEWAASACRADGEISLAEPVKARTAEALRGSRIPTNDASDPGKIPPG